MTASSASTAVRNGTALHLPTSPLARVQSSPSPTSSSSSASLSSMFDSPDFARYLEQRRMSDGSGDNARRESADSMTSWGSTGGVPAWTGTDDNRERAVGKSHTGTSTHERPSVGSKSSSDDSIATAASVQPLSTPPDLTMAHDFESYLFRQGAASPASSVTSTAPSKGDSTPRAELSAPIWPLASLSPRSLGQARINDESMDVDVSPRKEASEGSLRKANSIRRNGSWRKKHASLDTPPTTPFPAAYDMRDHASLPPNRPNAPHEPPHAPNFIKYVPPQSTKEALSPMLPEPEVKRRSGEFVRDSPPADHRVVAESEVTGCQISAPISPPALYPVLAGLHSSRRFSSVQSSGTTSSSASIASSSSSGSGHGHHVTLPPRWAQPPHHTNAVSGRAQSFSAGDSRPDVDFDPELFEGAEGEWIEIIKGSEGRIAIKSTPTLYEIMVWLPGFSLDNILITTRGQRTIHIVADQWDEGDHAQWDIRLGDDANMRAVNAKFSGAELRVSVARHIKASQYARFFRSASASAVSTASPAIVSTPSISGMLATAPTTAGMNAELAIEVSRDSPANMTRNSLGGPSTRALAPCIKEETLQG